MFKECLDARNSHLSFNILVGTGLPRTQQVEIASNNDYIRSGAACDNLLLASLQHVDSKGISGVMRASSSTSVCVDDRDK
jgi:hypothetical protein